MSFDAVDLYRPTDTLKTFTNRVKEYSDTDPVTDSYIKEIYYSIPLVQIFKKPPARAKLTNHYNISVPNARHEVDILYLPKDRDYKYAFVIVDVASRFRKVIPMKTKSALDAKDALKLIYDVDYLRPPQVLMSDQGSEFKGVFHDYVKSLGTIHVYNNVGHHLPFVESINRALAMKLFKVQNLAELTTSSVNREWVDMLYPVVDEMNRTPQDATKLEPMLAINSKSVKQLENDYSDELTSKYFPLKTKVRRLLHSDEVLDVATNKISIKKGERLILSTVLTFMKLSD